MLAVLIKLSPGWETDLKQAKEKAKVEHKYILLNFSGSDWCGPCIRMKEVIFDSRPFADFAESKLILVNADFPRMKKHQLTKDQQEKNNRLADQYDPAGNFPYTVLMDSTSKVLYSWEGLPPVSGLQFTSQLKDILNAAR